MFDDIAVFNTFFLVLFRGTFLGPIVLGLHEFDPSCPEGFSLSVTSPRRNRTPAGTHHAQGTMKSTLFFFGFWDRLHLSIVFLFFVFVFIPFFKNINIDIDLY